MCAGQELAGTECFTESFVTSIGCGVLWGTSKLGKVHILVVYKEKRLGILFLSSSSGLLLNLLLGSVYMSCE